MLNDSLHQCYSYQFKQFASQSYLGMSQIFLVGQPVLALDKTSQLTSILHAMCIFKEFLKAHWHTVYLYTFGFHF